MISREDYDRYEITPWGLEKPLIFSVFNYLTEQSTDDQELIRQLARRDAEQPRSSADSTAGFSTRPGPGRPRRTALADVAARDVRATQGEAERLAGELDDVPVVRNV
jgi:hypothetical protein